MSYLVKNFLPSGATMSSDEIAEGAKLDVNSQPITDFIALLKRKGIVLDPTMNVFEDKYGKHDGQEREYYENMMRLLKRLYDAGAALVIGTDAPRSPGLSLHHEMEIWVRAGVPPAKVLQIATIGAARVMKVDGETGAIRAGKKADFVLTEGDPTQTISDVRRCWIVVKNGVVYHSADLYKTVSITPTN
jgi:imidazolonepropionase-like amidohydrolase